MENHYEKEPCLQSEPLEPLEGGMSTANVGIAWLITHAHDRGPFDDKTGRFKTSLVSHNEKKASTKPEALLSQHDNDENTVQVVDNKGFGEDNVG